MNILDFSDQIISKLKNDLAVIKFEGDNKLIQFESAFYLVDRALDKIKLFMSHYDFVSEEEEINFFKNQMTYFLKQSVYFSELFNLESIKPPGPINEIRKFYEKELASIQEYLQENQNLYNYLLLKKENQDRVFFLRSAQVPVYKPNLFWQTLDTRYCTVYTLYCARIMGSLALADYFQNQLAGFPESLKQMPKDNIPILKWTGKKIDLVELIYAIKESNSVNNGNASVVDIAGLISDMFGINLKGFYRTFIEIRSRKKKRTVFLDHCKEKLEDYMNSLDRFEK